MFCFTFVSDHNTDYIMLYSVQLKNMYSYLNSSLKLSDIVRGLSCQQSYCNLLSLYKLITNILYQCKGMSGTAASHVFCNQVSKLCHEPSGGQIVKSQEISVFIMLPCCISSSNGKHLSIPNCTQTLILCKFYLLIYHTR